VGYGERMEGRGGEGRGIGRNRRREEGELGGAAMGGEVGEG